MPDTRETVSPHVTAAVQYVIRNAGFHVGTMPLSRYAERYMKRTCGHYCGTAR